MKKNNINIKLSAIFLILILFLNSCSHYQKSQKEIPHYRIAASNEIVSDAKLLSQSLTTEAWVSEERTNDLKIILENLSKFLIDGTNLPDEEKLIRAKRAEVYFKRALAQHLDNIQFQEANSLTKIIAIEKAPYWTLKDELDYLEQRQLNRRQLFESLNLFELLKVIDSSAEILSPETKKLINEEIIKNNLPEIAELSQYYERNGAQKAAIKIIGPAEAEVQKLIKRLRNLGGELAKFANIDMEIITNKIMVDFINYYFQSADEAVIKTIISEFLSEGVHDISDPTSEEKAFKIIFSNVGPGLGKFLQQMGKEKNVDPKLSKILETLESSGKSVPVHLVQNLTKKDPGGYVFASIRNEPIGTGTMAQVSLAELVLNNGNKEPVALRYLKPNIDKRAQEDIKILKHFLIDFRESFMAQGFSPETLENLIGGVEKFLLDELDLKTAISQQEEAYDHYTRSVKATLNETTTFLDMKIPRIYHAPKAGSQLHVQEFLGGGVKFSKIEDKEIQRFVASEMLKMWFEESIYRSGFFHADLHQGNFRTLILEEGKHIKVFVYDFGLTANLTKEEQRAFLLFGAGIHYKSPELMVKAISISHHNENSLYQKEMMSFLKEEFKNHPERKFEEWLELSAAKNLLGGQNLAAFSRGAVLMKQLPTIIGDDEMLIKIVLKGASKSLVRSYIDHQNPIPLKAMDYYDIAKGAIKNGCKDMLNNFIKLFAKKK